MSRYKVIDDSVSAHCCFGFTVVDTTNPEMIGDKQYVSSRYGPAYEEVCECFTREDAEMICNALNQMDEKQPTQEDV